MGQSTPFKPIALVVEDDELQREMITLIFEECDMGVIQWAVSKLNCNSRLFD